MTNRSHENQAPVALVTGGSSGLGLALTRALLTDGWRVITDARDATRLTQTLGETTATLISGDISDPTHRATLAAAVQDAGRLDLLVHNASTLGPVPMVQLDALSPESLRSVFETNALAPLALTLDLLAQLQQSNGILLSITSDAAVEHYETWGAYAASKAALEHLTLTVGAETGLRAFAVDPGDMRTPMHQDAFQGEDISDRPEPERVVPALLRLIADRRAPGRYRASDLTDARTERLVG